MPTIIKKVLPKTQQNRNLHQQWKQLVSVYHKLCTAQINVHTHNGRHKNSLHSMYRMPASDRNKLWQVSDSVRKTRTWTPVDRSYPTWRGPAGWPRWDGPHPRMAGCWFVDGANFYSGLAGKCPGPAHTPLTSAALETSQSHWNKQV